jgi:hypothetical protein
MDLLLIVLRVVHVGSAMAWFGGAVISSFFLLPTVQALGPAGEPFMDHLLNRRRMGVFFPIVPNDAQRDRLERADRRMQLANRMDLPLILLAGLTMSIARYLKAHRIGTEAG